MQVLRHLLRHRQMLCVEALDLFDRSSGVLGEVEDIYPSLGQDNPHTDCGVSKRVDGVVGVREWSCSIPALGPKPRWHGVGNARITGGVTGRVSFRDFPQTYPQCP